MRRSLDWKRHPLLVASAVVLTGVLVLEVGGAVAAAALLALAVLLMDRFGWLRVRRLAQEMSIRVSDGFEYEKAFAAVFRHCTLEAELTDLSRPSPGAGADLLHSVGLKRGESVEDLMRGIDGVIESRRDGR